MNEAVSAIHKRFTYRMQDLAEFMKGLLQRFTQWFNRAHSRSGTLWEDRFKSVIVEDGVAARTISDPVDGIIDRIQGNADLSGWSTTIVSEIVPTLDAGSPARDNTGWKYRTSRTAGNIGSDPRHFIRAVIESAP